MHSVVIFLGENLKKYSFPGGHPFSVRRVELFEERVREILPAHENIIISEPTRATESELLSFHTAEYLDFVRESSKGGLGYLDQGDTPSFKGVFEAASTSVGSTLKGLRMLLRGKIDHAFNPIGGLHHAKKDGAAGFCVFNDAAIAIVEAQKAGLERILYVDIDAHHGDGVFYAFYDDPSVYIVDIHEDGRYLYPGTGFRDELGGGEATGRKKNIPLPKGSGDLEFKHAFSEVEMFANWAEPQLVIFQCGADGLGGDPITHLRYTPKSHKLATVSLHRMAHKFSQGRILALGGGGYNLDNVSSAWLEVVVELANKE
ncbi:MAG: acetoin utilization protein AcuC [Nitrososphaerales archaeon]